MKVEVKKVTCVGAGLIGRGWATTFTLKGYDVILYDLSRSILDDAIKRIRQQIRFLVKMGLGENIEASMDRLETSICLDEALKDVDYVQESIYEKYEDKKAIYGAMDSLTSSETILASSTSGLLMSEIQKAAKRHPKRCVIVHPWNPPHIIPLVEVVPGKETSEETTQRTTTFMEQIGKVPVVLNREVPGFIANRLSAALWREALDLVDRGVASVEEIDKAVRYGPGMRWAIMGPFLTYHLGGGSGGIEYFLDHIDISKAEWLKTMAKWNVTPRSAVRKAIEGVSTMIGDLTTEELEEWRDRYLVQLLRLLT